MAASYRPGANRFAADAAMRRLQPQQAPQTAPQQPTPQVQQPRPQPAPQQPAVQPAPVQQAQPVPQAPAPPPEYLTPMPPVSSFVANKPKMSANYGRVPPGQPVRAQQPAPPPQDATSYYDPEAARRDHGSALAANKAQHDASFNATAVDPTKFNMNSYNYMRKNYGY